MDKLNNKPTVPSGVDAKSVKSKTPTTDSTGMGVSGGQPGTHSNGHFVTGF